MKRYIISLIIALSLLTGCASSQKERLYPKEFVPRQHSVKPDPRLNKEVKPAPVTVL